MAVVYKDDASNSLLGYFFRYKVAALKRNTAATTMLKMLLTFGLSHLRVWWPCQPVIGAR
jgi:hypothetical protein